MKWMAVPAFAALLAGCVSTGDVWDYYDACSANGGRFTDIVECGKRTRTTGCTASYSCSANGNAFVAYADSLAVSVRSGEMTEAEATRRLLEYRSTMQRQKDALAPQEIRIRRF
jgi:hypothetical protein